MDTEKYSVFHKGYEWHHWEHFDDNYQDFPKGKNIYYIIYGLRFSEIASIKVNINIISVAQQFIVAFDWVAKYRVAKEIINF